MTSTPPQATPPYPTPQGAMVCTWHPDRATALTCSRCGRPACPECLAPASVGFHCRACVAEARAAQRVVAPRTIAGARPAAGITSRKLPVVTTALIVLNLLVFAFVAFQARSLTTFGGSPGYYQQLIEFDGSQLYEDALLVPMAVAGGQWWRLLASGFLHLSVTHIALNMLALYFIGVGLERVLGTWRYLVLYLLSLLGGSAAVMLFSNAASASAGASGAIFGLMGALLVTLKRLKLDMRQAGIVIGINVFATFAIPNISWQAHLGGLVVGALVGAALVYAPAAQRLKWQLGACIAVAVVLIAILVVKDVTLGDWVCPTGLPGPVRCIPPPA